MIFLASARYRFILPLLQQQRLKSSKQSVSKVLSSASRLNLNKAELRDYERNHSHGTPKKPLSKPQRKLRPKSSKTRRYSSAKESRPRSEESINKPETLPNSEVVPGRASYSKRLETIELKVDEPFIQAQKPRNEDVPKLAHRLDRVLFSPGVHFLQDPRTRIFNFPPSLKTIVPYDNFDFDKISAFVSASKDKTLLEAAIKNGRTFYSSTSSMTSTLHQLYLFLNNYSSHERSQDRFDFPKFTRNATGLPSSVIVEPKGVNNSTGKTIYSVTSDKSTDVEILLSAMGHCLETLLTTEEEEFKKYLLDSNRADAGVPEQTENANIYNYSAYGDFLMRSQLDCYDPRLPGNGTFDLKTRAVCAIRYDNASEKSPTSYQIWKLNGKIESFEREYQDLIRTGGLLKYAFQARIGQMDGIFVAYHNISSFFGFQYLPLSEIDKVFYSHASIDNLKENSADAEQIEAFDNHASAVAESQFKISLNIWQDIMKIAIGDLSKTEYKNMPFRLVMKRAVKPVSAPGETKSKRERIDGPHDSFLRVFVLPLHGESVDQLQGFSTQLQTSFRDDIPWEEKVKNLEATKKNLDAYNSELLKKSTLLSYNVRAWLNHDGENLTGKGRHSYPLSGTGESKWSYRIDQVVEPENTESIQAAKYLDLLKKATSLLTNANKKRPSSMSKPSLVENLRAYSEIGKKRLEKWKDDENPPRIL